MNQNQADSGIPFDSIGEENALESAAEEQKALNHYDSVFSASPRFVMQKSV